MDTGFKGDSMLEPRFRFTVRCGLLGLMALPALAAASTIALFTNAGDPAPYCTAPDTCFAIISDATSTQSSLSQRVTAGRSVASAYGNLATGAMGVMAATGTGLQGGGGGADGSATLWETIHVHGTVAAPMTGKLTVNVHGSLTPDLAYEQVTGGAASAYASLQMTVNGVNTTPFSLYSFQSSGCPPSGVIGSGAGAQSCVNTLGITATIDELFDISADDQAFSFYINLNAVGVAGGLADLSHTALLSLSLPAGLSFTSESGVFLSQSPFSVGEPPTAWLVTSAVALWLRRRTQTAGKA